MKGYCRAGFANHVAMQRCGESPLNKLIRKPAMSDPLLPLLLLLRYMHILGAIALMGGTIFMRFALAPTVATLDPATKGAIHEQVRSRWSKFVMLAAGFLLVSGLTNLLLAGRYDF